MKHSAAPSDQSLARAAPTNLPDPLRRLVHHLIQASDRRDTAAMHELQAALQHPDPWVRLHAVAGLAHINDAAGCAELATALHDPSFGVRWAAADALAVMGRRGVVTVLRRLAQDTPSAGFRHAAGHVLRHAALGPEGRAAVAPVLDALQHPAADLSAPVQAAAALRVLHPAAAPRPDEVDARRVIRRDRRALRGRTGARPAGTRGAVS